MGAATKRLRADLRDALRERDDAVSAWRADSAANPPSGSETTEVRAHRACAVLTNAAVAALPALLDALDAAERNRDDAMIRAAEDQDEHSAQRAALAAEVERLREPMPCGHPGACIVTSDEGTAHCRWCEEVERLRAAYDSLAEAGWVSIATLRADLTETRLQLAIWSGEGVPEGWEAAADGEPYLVRRRGEWAVTLDPAAGGGAVWAGWWRLGECERCEEREYQRTATATEALAAAEAWLAGVAP